MPSPRIPSVRARSKQHEAIKRKPPATSFNNPSLAVGAVGVYGPLLRGRYAQNLQASIHWTPRDQQPPSPETTLSTGGCGGTNDHDQNHDSDEDTDSKQAGTTDDDKASNVPVRLLLEENLSSDVDKATTNSFCSDASHISLTVGTPGGADRVVPKKCHPAPADTHGTENNSINNSSPATDFVQGLSGESTLDATPTDFLPEDDDAVPGPPPLHRWTGRSTRFNSYNTAWSGVVPSPSAPFTLESTAAVASADLDCFLGAFLDTSGDLDFDSVSESSCENYLAQGLDALPTAHTRGRTDNCTRKVAPDAPVSGASPVSELSTLLAHVGPIGSVVSSDVNDDAIFGLPPNAAPNVLPAGSRVVQTPDGPAVLLSSLQTVAHPVARSSAPRQFQHWTEEEDALLNNAAAIEGGPPHNWKKISRKYFLGSRSDSQCKGRWKKALKPGINRAPWEAHEDEFLLQAREEGESWPVIATHLPGRIADSVRERYVNHLDPQLVKTPWTAQETHILYDAQKRLGNKWTTIAAFLPGRSENAIKNRWHNAKMMQRRAIRRLATTKARVANLDRARSHTLPVHLPASMNVPAADFAMNVPAADFASSSNIYQV